MVLGLIYARAANGVIGKEGKLPWHLPEDLAHFKRVTLGAPVIMGRRTWDSLPPKFRPLPGRRNIVVTRQVDWHVEGAERAASLEQALASCAHEPKAWIIGGAELYRQAERRAHVVEVTEIEQDFDGDAFAPTLGGDWREVARERIQAASGLHLSFVRFER
ncbi:dihydrofolate reductase [Ramlibacter algicola]|uniref:Dihydrofolate reductase n=1 Tax=Ramlibacter algicola TaxID=2795217 RepID=A0A934Q3Y2_9BURK|nr:dihydrofolate reductase [Ramlibacter algicola]MBK0394146.1 dihydrofolate reductase [Ramlibacter algicola]